MIFSVWAKFQSGTLFSSVLPFRTKSVLNEWSSLNLMLTSNSTDLGEAGYTKVVDNFDTFLVSIYTPSSDKWSRVVISGIQGVLLENSSFWTDRQN
jgi:hypothetical protein